MPVPESPDVRFLTPLRPRDIPGLVCFWDFQGDRPLVAKEGNSYELVAGTENLQISEYREHLGVLKPSISVKETG